MNQTQLLVVIVVIAVIAVAGILFFARKRRSQKLRERFGPEYDRVVKQEGEPRKAEGVLEFREQRREKFKIRPLSATARSSFAVRWKEVQSGFVDDPRAAVTVAESLVSEVMQARGYPIGEFEQRRRYFGGLSGSCGKLSCGPCDRAAPQGWPGQHRGSAAGDGALPQVISRTAR